jgi:AraC family transcriptional regulator
MNLARLYAANAGTEKNMLNPTGLQLSDYRPGTAMAPHEHADATLSIILRGDYDEQIGKSRRHYARGYIVFCPAGMVHSQRFGQAGARQIIVTPQDGWMAYLADCKLKLDDAPYASAPAFRQLGDKLLEELLETDDFAALAREGILLEIVAAFGRTEAARSHGGAPPLWLRATRDLLHQDPYAHLTMTELARAAGRHEVHVAREFRRFFGVSVGAYRRQLRTEAAARLLSRPTMSVSEIAQSCGFASHSHLCREFKALFGITPSQYRTRHR